MRGEGRERKVLCQLVLTYLSESEWRLVGPAEDQSLRLARGTNIDWGRFLLGRQH